MRAPPSAPLDSRKRLLLTSTTETYTPEPDQTIPIPEQTWAEYEAKLEDNLRALLDRLKSGTYYAPPVRRVHIPKGDGRTRPIGIPTLEDKILQRGVAMVLEAIYEQDFMDGSYGFRPGRGAHDALQAL